MKLRHLFIAIGWVGLGYLWWVEHDVPATWFLVFTAFLWYAIVNMLAEMQPYRKD